MQKTMMFHVNNYEIDNISLDVGSDIISMETESKKRNIIDKLQFCKSICNIDPNRTKMEIDNIINIIEDKK